jgi:hypothetical protein
LRIPRPWNNNPHEEEFRLEVEDEYNKKWRNFDL